MNRTARVMLLAAVAAVAVVAFVVLRPEDGAQGPTATTPTPTATSPAGRTSRPQARPRPVLIRVRDGRPVGGVRRIEASKGELVRFRVLSDTAEQVHVHGYDLLRQVPAGGTVTFRFSAGIEGVFEVELENTHRQIAQLRVSP